MRRPSEILRGILLALCLASPALHAEEIKIEVVRGAARILVQATGARWTQGAGPAPLALAHPDAAHRISAQGDALEVDGAPARPPIIIRAGARPLQLGERLLPGRLEIWVEAGALVAINALDLEDYVAGVVSSEVPGSWPQAALQAQAVAARTYAVAQKIAQGPGSRAHLVATVLDQVFAGVAKPSSGAQQAARATAGQVLTFGSAPIAAYFSSSCGGRSEAGEDAFRLPPGSTPYLRVQEDGDADRGAPRERWTVRLPLASLAARLAAAGRSMGSLRALSVAARTAGGRVRTVRLDTGGGARSLDGAELRRLVGYGALPSLLFEVEMERPGTSAAVAVLHGRGSGHGVGLCQWGAHGRALHGESYRQILGHYYPGAEIRPLY